LDAASEMSAELARLAGGAVQQHMTGSVVMRRSYYVKDHLGSVRAVINSSGQVVEARDYSRSGS
jgi:hypothetical protein